MSPPLKLIANSLILFLFWTIVPAWALNTDQSQPLKMSSDSATYDREKHIIIYEGDVRAHQGTSNLEGEKMIIYQSADNKIDHLETFGKPAHYNTIPEPNKSRMYVTALKISYYPNKKLVILEGNAVVKQENNLFSGPYIWYDMMNGIVHSKTNKTNERTVVVIQPQSQQ